MANPESVSELWKRLAEAGFDEDSVTRIKAQIENSLNVMLAESDVVKDFADTKLVESKKLLRNAQTKTIEAELKLAETELSKAQAKMIRHNTESILQDVNAREDKCAAKEKEFSLQRQSVIERQKSLQHVDGRDILQREKEFLERQKELRSHVDFFRQATREMQVEMDKIEFFMEEEVEKKRKLMERGLGIYKNDLNMWESSLKEHEKSVVEFQSTLVEEKDKSRLSNREETSSPVSAPVSFLKRWASAFFEQS